MIFVTARFMICSFRVLVQCICLTKNILMPNNAKYIPLSKYLSSRRNFFSGNNLVLNWPQWWPSLVTYTCIPRALDPFNSLAPGGLLMKFQMINFQANFSHRWSRYLSWNCSQMWLDLTDDKSTLVQVMAWCRQTTSYYLSQCWPRSMSPYGVTRP